MPCAAVPVILKFTVIALAAGAEVDTVKTALPPLRILVGDAERLTAGFEEGVGVGVAVGVGVGVADEVKAV